METKKSTCSEEESASLNARIMNVVSGVSGVAKVTKCIVTDTVSASAEIKRGYDVELRLAVEYGSSIPGIHEQIKRMVSENIRPTTDLEIQSLSLCVEDIQGLPYECRR